MKWTLAEYTDRMINSSELHSKKTISIKEGNLDWEKKEKSNINNRNGEQSFFPRVIINSLIFN